DERHLDPAEISGERLGDARGESAEDERNVLAGELLGGGEGGVLVARVVLDDELDGPAEDAAFLVDLGGGDLVARHFHRAEGGEAPGERGDHSQPDGVRGGGRKGSEEEQGGNGGGP